MVRQLKSYGEAASRRETPGWVKYGCMLTIVVRKGIMERVKIERHLKFLLS